MAIVTMQDALMALKNSEAENKVLRAFVKDLMRVGLRTDLNPTKTCRKDWNENEEWWHLYLRQANDDLKARAARALKIAGGELPGETP